MIHDCYVERVALMPADADPPLIVDPNAVLSGPIALELLEPIAQRRPEILGLLRRIDYHELGSMRCKNSEGKRRTRSR